MLNTLQGPQFHPVADYIFPRFSKSPTLGNLYAVMQRLMAIMVNESFILGGLHLIGVLLARPPTITIATFAVHPSSATSPTLACQSFAV